MRRALLTATEKPKVLVEDVFTTLAEHSWTAPAGVTSIEVEAWGCGGKGGSASFGRGGGGGGGGAYAKKSGIPVNPGNTYKAVIGAGSGNGCGFRYSTGSSYLCFAASGAHGNGAGGAGGDAFNCIGDVTMGALNGTSGTSAAGGAGGAAANGGGAGQPSVSGYSNGVGGIAPGGGASGNGPDGSTFYKPPGGLGKVIIRYYI